MNVTRSLWIVPAAYGLVACSEPVESTRTTRSEMLEDNSEITALEQELESGVELALAGSAMAPEQTPESGADAASAAVDNAGVFLRPAGCITSVREGNVAVHEFTACTSPNGRLLDGRVTSTWTVEGSTLTVLHDAEAFRIDEAVVDHSTRVEYRRGSGGTVLRDRTSSTVGTTGRGRSIDHSAQFFIQYDPASDCYERKGSGDATIGDHTWSRNVEGWKACGAWFTCPHEGRIELSGPRADGSITITEPGRYEFTLNGRTQSFDMRWCIVDSDASSTQPADDQAGAGD